MTIKTITFSKKDKQFPYTSPLDTSYAALTTQKEFFAGIGKFLIKLRKKMKFKIFRRKLVHQKIPMDTWNAIVTTLPQHFGQRYQILSSKCSEMFRETKTYVKKSSFLLYLFWTRQRWLGQPCSFFFAQFGKILSKAGKLSKFRQLVEKKLPEKWPLDIRNAVLTNLLKVFANSNNFQFWKSRSELKRKSSVKKIVSAYASFAHFKLDNQLDSIKIFANSPQHFGLKSCKTTFLKT